jgi:hypothetical protein
LADAALAASDVTMVADERPVGETVGTTPARRPGRVPLEGRFVSLVPLDPDVHAHGLFAASHDGSDEAARMWTYLAYGPWSDEASMRGWLEPLPASEDPLFLVVIDPTGDPWASSPDERRSGDEASGARQHLVRASCARTGRTPNPCISCCGRRSMSAGTGEWSGSATR